jgi:hypothetical protein
VRAHRRAPRSRTNHAYPSSDVRAASGEHNRSGSDRWARRAPSWRIQPSERPRPGATGATGDTGDTDRRGTPIAGPARGPAVRASVRGHRSPDTDRLVSRTIFGRVPSQADARPRRDAGISTRRRRPRAFPRAASLREALPLPERSLSGRSVSILGGEVAALRSAGTLVYPGGDVLALSWSCVREQGLISTRWPMSVRDPGTRRSGRLEQGHENGTKSGSICTPAQASTALACCDRAHQA